jgi:hypothetical protein
MTNREKAWFLLSDLYVDTEYTEDQLVRLAKALAVLGFSLRELTYILKNEVGPVAGSWMCYPGTIGPWPAFDEEDLKNGIIENLKRPWYRKQRRCLLAILATRKNWITVKSNLRKDLQ